MNARTRTPFLRPDGRAPRLQHGTSGEEKEQVARGDLGLGQVGGLRAVQLQPATPSPSLDASALIEVSRSDRDQIAAVLQTLSHNPYDGDLEVFLREVELAFADFPRDFRRRVLEFRDNGNLDGVLLIRGLPRDGTIPPTPLKPNIDARRSSYRGEALMGSVAKALGQPVAYFPEKEGKVFQGIYALLSEALRQTNGSSATFLKFHTEVAFHRHMLAYVLLYGLRQDRERQAKTIVSSIRRVLPHLTLAQRRQLSVPQFRTRVDLSFGGGDGPVVPVLSGDPSDPFLRFDDDFMEATTVEGQRALIALRNAVNLEKREIAIEAGDLVIIDNQRNVHARSEFLAHHDGADRWLLRLGVVRDLYASLDERLPGTRIIASDSFTNL